MLSILWKCYSAVQAALRYFMHRAVCLCSCIFPALTKNSPFTHDKPHDLEDNATSTVVDSPASNCNTYTIQPQPQLGLEILGVGASGQVYEVDERIVLKTCRIFKRPGSDASESDRWHYASDTVFHSSLLQDERAVLHLLQQRPHPHIMKAIDTDQPEGIYLRKYLPLVEDKIPSAQIHRIQWYRDITDALCHLHSFGIAHADIRIENILLDGEHDRLILCDFSGASPFGHPNLVFSDLPVPINGPSPILSEATDMFAMGSLIFRMEHGAKPQLSVENGTLVVPNIQTGHPDIDTIIRKAWLGHYSHTSEMLRQLRLINGTRPRRSVDSIDVDSESKELLRGRIRKWRELRNDKFGCVLHGILPENELRDLADCYGLDINADRRFTGYCFRGK